MRSNVVTSREVVLGSNSSSRDSFIVIVIMSYQSVGSIEPEPMIERILLLKQEAFVYKIPPGQVPADESTGWLAKGWNLEKPEVCKLKLVSKGTNCSIKLADKYIVSSVGENPDTRTVKLLYARDSFPQAALLPI